ncbi:restriction endonuclease subunit S [Acinetobacter junii]|uniref:restriction endonuclease subunit S n=1 Tax=Acinetobacter junii TaxID=40215 RepID=UPI0012504FC6|nr:restriction endonuclease subunit S [Acinetobacter junii]
MKSQTYPKNWDIEPLKNSINLINGRAYALHEWESSGIPVIRLQNLTGSSENYYYSNLNLPEKNYCYSGDLLYMWSATFGPYIWSGEKAIFHYHIWKLDISSRNDKGYIYHLLNNISENLKKTASNGGTMLHITKGFMDELLLPLPPLAEQQKIAQALTDADNYISSLEKLIEKKKQLKEASLISIFDFNNAEWEVKPLSDLCTYLNDGTHYTPRYTQEGIPFYSVENVTNNEFTDVKYISKEEHETLIRRCKPENGDILMTRIGSVGVTKLIDWDINASIYVSLALLKFKNREFVKYFYAYSKTPKFLQDTLSRSLINATPQKINMNEIGDIPVYFPKCQNEQVRIANIILNLEKEIEVLNIKLSKAKFLKQGMMQKLLTGEIRLA